MSDKSSTSILTTVNETLAFIFSVSIEMPQLLLRLGTFQLSDIFYNTVGGVIGGVCYDGIKKVIRKM